MQPYEGLEARAFWSRAVAKSLDLGAVYRKKFDIARTDHVVTAGSCFAQNITRQLVRRKYRLLDLEPPPPMFPPAQMQAFGYKMYSARYGNIYTTRQLLQLAQEAFGDWRPTEDVWEREGRFYDAFRPAIQPGGFGSASEVRTMRRNHLDKVRTLLTEMDVLVFTLGLTEAWMHQDAVYPVAPGVIAGAYDWSRHRFANFSYPEILTDLEAFDELVRKRRAGRGFRLLLTVSPVPLTATASDEHVLTATIHSKAILRSVAGELARRRRDVDYFPSYEIISNPWNGGRYFEQNKRSVTKDGVALVMQVFFGEVEVAAEASDASAPTLSTDPQCEEAVLEAFAT